MTAHPPVPTPTPDPLAELNRAGVSERAWLLYKLRAALDSKVIKGALAPMFVQEAIAQIEADERAHAPLVEACRRLIESADDYSTWGSEAALVALEEASERAREALASAEGGTLRAEDSR